MRKPWFCKPFQNGSYSFQKNHESNGKWQRHVCATCLERGKILSQSEKQCTWAKHPKNEYVAVLKKIFIRTAIMALMVHLESLCFMKVVSK